MAGTAANVELVPEAFRISIFNSAPGGFLVFGFLAALVQGIKQAKARKAGKKVVVEDPDCASCESAAGCKTNNSESCPVMEKTVEKAVEAAKEAAAAKAEPTATPKEAE